MKYLLLVYGDERVWADMPESQMDARVAATQSFVEAHERSGQLVASQRLQPSHTATLVRVQGPNKVTITDGPYAETHEQLGGFLLVEARDLNEAIRLASKFPCGEGTTIEVRPVRELLTSAQEAERASVGATDRAA